MNDLRTISEKEILSYAMKGICESIIRAPLGIELDRLNEQFEEMYKRKKQIENDEKTAPF